MNSLKKLEEFIPKENIKYNEPMRKHTSFKTGGNADCFIIVKDIDQIKSVINFAKKNNLQLHIIGNGSNTLVLDKGIRGIVLKIDLTEIKIENLENDVIVSVGAGVKIMALAQQLKQKSISGFEEFSGIPGTMGGANRMNAGAYGKELKDIILETKCLNIKTGKIEVLEKEEQKLVYRGSIFKNNNYIILETKIGLQYGNKDEIEEKMNNFLKERKEKQPIEFPSAGSTFKRGENYITAKLIDECGLKGCRIGGAEVSTKHAGFVINKENATAKDILDLIKYVKGKIYEKYNIKIEEEIEIMGEQEE